MLEKFYCNVKIMSHKKYNTKNYLSKSHTHLQPIKFSCLMVSSK